ncbi:MAG: DEAD/DEAH box helicase [Oceanospirillaceae bacterium]|nr:DEAD/DEAH box helicase [Oceanospirillaceae bacterium]MCP5335410.1 DEAD/DEAH box helicase [Oceanospirillaceae bacterium]MCP5351419.1 DEAD/DEAH box helicase [Oceanospirillaceae bacterium]
MTQDANATGFASLGLPVALLRAIEDMGYEQPSPIQVASIPALLEGKDMIGMAQTGTGKTAAFALPLLARTQLNNNRPQVLVLAPTRELAQQVAEACQQYARHLGGVSVATLVGGQDFTPQLRELKRGAQWVVGTPGRVMDHMRRGTLDLSDLRGLVLDEADEMLRMGFIDDVEWVLSHTPSSRQIALFSATMPHKIRELAQSYLSNPVEVKIESKTSTASTITQKFWVMKGMNKVEALSRLIEVMDFSAMMIFVRTKNSAVDICEQLANRGIAAEALHGDMSQPMRERVVTRLKNGQTRIVLATDVAARGLDVEQISHVVNFDIPYDTEAYVHRIGRTGRAGRTGEAILFVAPRETRMLATIERATKQRMEPLVIPTAKEVNAKRREKFKAQILAQTENPSLAYFTELFSEFQKETEWEWSKVAAAMACLYQGNRSMQLEEREARPEREERPRREDRDSRSRDERGSREERPRREPRERMPDSDMQAFRLDVGRNHGVKPGNIVGAIANEANLDSKYIGNISIQDTFSTVYLPAGIPADVLATLQRVQVCGRAMNLSKYEAGSEPPMRSKYSERSDRPARAPREGGRGDAPRGDSRNFRNDRPRTDGQREGARKEFRGEGKTRRHS